MRTRLLLTSLKPDEMLTLIEHLLDRSGAPQLMSAGLKNTLSQHCAGNPRILTHTGAELLDIAASRDLAQLDEALFLEVCGRQASRFEVGAWHGRGFLEGCVGVRLHDPTGRPLGYTGRRCDPAARYSKWKLPAGLPKRSLLYNVHRLGPSGGLLSWLKVHGTCLLWLRSACPPSGCSACGCPWSRPRD